MKQIDKLIYILGVILLLTSCENFDREFEDFEYTAGYFPYQYPVRTLVLGDYIYDNTNDNAHKFIVSVAMGGVYENKKDRKFDVVVDESLCDNLLFKKGGDEVKPLPSNYYTLSSANQIVISKGKFNGGVEVQLSDDFFADPQSIKNTYVVPIKLLGSADVDSIIPDKNFTLFAVKYINEYHGSYFHYGKSKVMDAAGKVVEELAYDQEKFVEKNPIMKLLTTGRYQVSMSHGLKTETFEGTVNMLLNFQDNKCTVSSAADSKYVVTGTGEFQRNAYTWGNKERNGIVLNYTITNEKGYTYTASDVLVIRDRDVVMEVFSPVAKK